MSACRSCGAPIFFASSRATGKPIPIDVDERSDGNIVIEADGKAVVLGDGSSYTGPRYVSHFVTCPDDKDWRRKR